MIEDGQLRAYLDGELDDASRDAVAETLRESASDRARADDLLALGQRVDQQLELDAAQPDMLTAWAKLQPSVKPRSRWPVAVILAAAATVLLVWALGSRGEAHNGEAHVSSRETIAVANRAVAVAEPGARMSWQVDADGQARVTQSQGSVFYRVEAGAAFDVATPAGTVTVTGTCFTVELRPMKTSITHAASALGGAAVATALFLTVHEGSVVLANDAGNVELEAGQKARARAGERPHLDDGGSPPAPQTHASLRAENEQLRATIASLREETQVARPSSRPDDAEPTIVGGCANAVGAPGCSTLEPTQEVLEERARCGTVLVDKPKFMTDAGYDLDPELAELVGLDEREQEKIRALNEKFTTDYAETLVGLINEANELNGNPGQARLGEETPPWAAIRAFSSVIEGASEDVGKDARRHIAKQRAGLEPAPQDLGKLHPFARYYHLDADLGNAYERALAKTIGEGRAHELRVAQDGWRSKHLQTGECPGDAQE